MQVNLTPIEAFTDALAARARSNPTAAAITVLTSALLLACGSVLACVVRRHRRLVQRTHARQLSGAVCAPLPAEVAHQRKIYPLANKRFHFRAPQKGGERRVYFVKSQDGTTRKAISVCKQPSKLWHATCAATADKIKGLAKDYPYLLHEELVDEHRGIFISEPLDGDLFSLLIEAGKQGDQRDLLHLTYDLLRAVELLHRADVAHLDIKPSNILYRRVDGVARAVLADFGFAVSAVDFAGTRVKPSTRGTRDYHAPELKRMRRIEKLEHAKQADLYSVAATVTALWTCLVFERDMLVNEGDIEGGYGHKIPAWLRTVLEALSHPTPERRLGAQWALGEMRRACPFLDS